MNPVAAFFSKPLSIAVLVAGILAFIYFKGKAAGSDKAIYNANLPNNGTGIPAVKGPGGQMVSWDPMPLVDMAFDVLDGWFGDWTFDKEILFQKMQTLTDDQLVAMSNAFNRKYKGKDTLLEYVDGEFIAGGEQDNLVARMRNLKLK